MVSDKQPRMETVTCACDGMHTEHGWMHGYYACRLTGPLGIVAVYREEVADDQ